MEHPTTKASPSKAYGSGNDDKKAVVPSSIRTILGPCAKIYLLEDFLQAYTPSLQFNLQNNAALGGKRRNAVLSRLKNTLISPCTLLKPMPSMKTARCQEPLTTLVDGVIWSLVVNHQKNKKKKNYNRGGSGGQGANVLSKGYQVASELLERDVTRCSHMNAGVMCTKINGNVSFCKTSRYFQTLHTVVGDDLLRMMLLRTNMFIPLLQAEEEDGSDSMIGTRQCVQNNFMMICGPQPITNSKNGLLPACSPDSAGCQSAIMDSNNKQLLEEQQSPRRNSRKRKRRGTQPQQQLSDAGRQQPNSTSDPLSSSACINRRSLFYSHAFLPKVGFPKDHVLNEVKQLKKGGEVQMLEHMIPLWNKSNGRKRRKRWNRLRNLAPEMCREILVRHSKFDYHRTLERHCPLPQVVQATLRDRKAFGGDANDVNGPEQQPTLSELSAAHTNSGGVVAFLSSTLASVFPDSFWGSSHNFQRILSLTDLFVNLRRNEDLPNKTIMKGIHVTDFIWLLGDSEKDDCPHQQNPAKGRKLSRSGHEAVTLLVTTVLRWVFGHFVVPLLRSNFFVTESEMSAKRVLYYRKPAWSMFRSLAMNHLLSQQYREIKPKEAQARLQNQQLGCSKLRLLPKASGVRPIATLCKADMSIFHEMVKHNGHAQPQLQDQSTKIPSSDNFRKRQSINYVLRDTHEALKYERSKNPSLFGSGLLGLHDFYPRFHQFAASVKRRSTKVGASSELNFASVDVRHCYDNIDEDRLLDIVAGILSEEDYMIHRYAVLQTCEGLNQIIKSKKSEVGPPHSVNSFHRQPARLRGNIGGAVYLDDATSGLVDRTKVMLLLREHLKSHLVVAPGRHGNRYLIQAKGIPQGSILSGFLCNYYYGNLEKTLLGNDVAKKLSLDNKDSPEEHLHLLVRIIDDLLLITTDKAMHKSFLQAMHRGKPSLGFQINKDKVFSNVAVVLQNEDGTANPIYGMDSGQNDSFPWCGMLIGTKSCEVSIDYTRFSDGKAADALTVSLPANEGAQLKKFMKVFLIPRCLPILFDSSINTRATLESNFFDMMVLCAVKSEEFIKRSGMDGSPSRNPEFIIDCITNAILFSLQRIQSRLAYFRVQQDCNRRRGSATLNLNRSRALWLGLKGFHTVFQRYAPLRIVTSCIEERLSKISKGPSVQELQEGGSQVGLLIKT